MRRRARRPLTAEQQKLIESNVGVVHDFARRHASWAKRFQVDYDDFVGDLLEFLIDQVGLRFDPDRASFTTFAWMVMFNRLYLYRQARLTNKREGIDQTRHLGDHGHLLKGKNMARLDLVEARDEIVSRWHVLSDREQHVLLGRFWKLQPLKEIAGELKITRERVRQIQNEAIAKLRGAA